MVEAGQLGEWSLLAEDPPLESCPHPVGRVKGGHPTSEDDPKPHGLHNLVKPGEADPVVGVKEVQAQQISWLLMAVEVFS